MNVCISYIQGVKLESGPCDSEDDAMETDVIDKQACFVLFQKFVREVSFIFYFDKEL